MVISWDLNSLDMVKYFMGDLEIHKDIPWDIFHHFWRLFLGSLMGPSSLVWEKLVEGHVEPWTWSPCESTFLRFWYCCFVLLFSCVCIGFGICSTLGLFADVVEKLQHMLILRLLAVVLG